MSEKKNQQSCSLSNKSERELYMILTKVDKIIENRINEAKNSKILEKISEILENFGDPISPQMVEMIYYGEGEVQMTFDKHLGEIALTNQGNRVFEAGLLSAKEWKISLFIPGHWQEVLNDVYNEIPSKLAAKRKEGFIEEIQKLTRIWNIALENVPGVKKYE